jgi:predicted nucleic acid-binding protein
MIVVDTSVFVDALRHGNGPAATTLARLLDADEVALAVPVRMELLAGVAPKDRTALLRGLSALPVLTPTDDTWAIAERWIAPAADKGQHFAIADLLIAALAEEIQALVWSLDTDFERLEALGLARLYAAPH